LRIATDFFETVANDGKGLFVRAIIQFVDELDALLVVKFTADAIKRVSGVCDKPPFLKDLADAIDKPLLRIVRINGDDHGVPF
jgi:hypothetical protein